MKRPGFERRKTPSTALILLWLVAGCGILGPDDDGRTSPEPDTLLPQLADSVSVRAIYAIPSDRAASTLYSRGVQNAIVALQEWYAEQLDRVTFPLYDTIPTVCHMAETGAYYTEDAWVRVLEDLQACAPVAANTESHVWLVWADVHENCGVTRLGAGGPGLAMMGRWDLRGLTDPTFNHCGFGAFGINRWIGGAGHELGHALGLPHPPGCEEGRQSCDTNALMWLGYASWPNTYLREPEKAVLQDSPFIIPIR